MGEFITRKIMGSEVDTKDFTRLFSEFNDILNTNMVLADKRDKISEEIFPCLEAFRIMEQKYREFCKLEEKCYKSIAKQINKGVKKLSDITFDDPSSLLRKHFEDFMIRGQFVIRYRNKICMIVFDDNKLDEGSRRREKLNELLELRKETLGPIIYKMYKEIMKEDEEWLTLFTQTRDKVEHVEKNNLHISDFKVELNNNVIDIKMPIYSELGERCDKFMNSMFVRLYLHVEDFISMFLNLTSDGFWVIKPFADEDTRKVKKKWYSINLGNRIYRIDLHDVYKEKFFSSDI